MRFLPSRTPRSRELRPRARFDRRLRVAEIVVLGIWIVLVAMFFTSPNFKRSRLRVAEIGQRAAACYAVQEYARDRQAARESLEEVVRAGYLSHVPANPSTHEQLSLLDCTGGPEDYMDPVETIPGVRHLYSYSTDTSGKRSYF